METTDLFKQLASEQEFQPLLKEFAAATIPFNKAGEMILHASNRNERRAAERYERTVAPRYDAICVAIRKHIGDRLSQEETVSFLQYLDTLVPQQ